MYSSILDLFLQKKGMVIFVTEEMCVLDFSQFDFMNFLYYRFAFMIAAFDFIYHISSVYEMTDYSIVSIRLKERSNKND